MKLRGRLLTLLVPLVVVPLLALGWIAYGQLQRTSEHKTLGQMTTLLEQLALHTRSLIETAQSNATVFSASHLLKQYALTKDEEERFALLQKPLIRQFLSFQNAYPDYYEMRFLLPNGLEDVRWSLEEGPNVTENESASPWFRQLQQSKDTVFTAFFWNPDNGEYALLAATPLRLNDPSVDTLRTAPRLRGYFVVTIRLSLLLQQIAIKLVDITGFMLVTDPDGVQVSSVSNPLANGFFDDGPPLSGAYDVHGAAVSRRVISADVFAQLLHTGVEQEPLWLTVGNERFLVTSRSPVPRLKLFGVLPEIELSAAARSLGLIVAGITVLAIVITTVLLFAALNRGLVSPIRALAKTAQRIGEGKLDASTGISRTDEIGDLATSFDEMSKSLVRFHEQIRFVAFHDNLTGLPNRLMFQEHLTLAIEVAKRSGSQLALLFLDLDNFKTVNDSLGHHCGDSLLKEFALTLTRCVRRSDVVAHFVGETSQHVIARLGGDEFVIMFPHITEHHALGQVAQRILSAFEKKAMLLNGHELFVSVSIGITVYPADGEDGDTLLRNADAAMYQAKHEGKGTYMYYSDAMNTAVTQRFVMENRLRKALKNAELALHYQPQVDARNNKIVGLEALIRWNSPEFGIVMPNRFLPLAEDTGLIIPIGDWVLLEACRQNKAWHEAGLPKLPVAVNVAGVQVQRGDLTSSVRSALKSSGLRSRYLEIELTETSLMLGNERNVEVLEDISALGVRIALDDFGVGYSSLGYLKDFPISSIKIDRTFVDTLGADQSCAKGLVPAIIAMAHALGLEVVAEGVENLRQLRCLIEQDCNIIQGLLFSKPLAANEIRSLFATERLAPQEEAPIRVWTGNSESIRNHDERALGARYRERQN